MHANVCTSKSRPSPADGDATDFRQEQTSTHINRLHQAPTNMRERLPKASWAAALRPLLWLRNGDRCNCADGMKWFRPNSSWQDEGALTMSTGRTFSRVAVVTGGFGALGQVVAAAASEHGFEVAVLGHTAKPPPDVAEKLKPNALLLGGVDLADEGAAKAAMTTVMSHFGRLDTLFNIAGGFRWIKLEDSHATDL
jgi:hypothetical protein